MGGRQIWRKEKTFDEVWKRTYLKWYEKNNEKRNGEANGGDLLLKQTLIDRKVGDLKEAKKKCRNENVKEKESRRKGIVIM